MSLDYDKFGVPESGVLLHVVTPPSRGTLMLDRRPLSQQAGAALPVVTALDVSSDR